jgi:hypothetical protein
MAGWSIVGMQPINGFLRDKYYVHVFVFVLNATLYGLCCELYSDFVMALYVMWHVRFKCGCYNEC